MANFRGVFFFYQAMATTHGNSAGRPDQTEVGIIFFLLIYGVLQERIMTEPYDQEVDRALDGFWTLGPMDPWMIFLGQKWIHDGFVLRPNGLV